MTQQIYVPLLVACLLNLSVAASSMADETKDKNTRGCISTRTLNKTAVVDDLNILFFKTGGTIYHNILPRECKGLSRFRAFSYSTLSGSLCNFDTIQVLNSNGLGGKSCRLGYFHTITEEDIIGIVNGAPRPTEPAPQPPAEVEDIIVEPDTSGESTPN
jgi:hypothetical protein